MLWLLVACATDTGVGTKPEDQQVVAGNGGAEVSPAELFIENCEVEYARSGILTLTSTGDENLLVYGADIVAGGDVFFTNAELDNAEFAPGQSTEITITATLRTAEPAEGLFRLRTNDPDHPSLDVVLHAWPLGYTPEDTGGGDTGGGDTGTGGDTGGGDTGTGGDTGAGGDSGTGGDTAGG
jgi:hypothetical protein